MRQMVVGLLVVAGVFTIGPWFAGKVGPPLAGAITEWATPEQPCATPTAEPSKKVRPKKDRPHAARKHRKPKADKRAKQRAARKAKASPTCGPTSSPVPRRAQGG